MNNNAIADAKARRLNRRMEDAENWFLNIGGKVFRPPSWENPASRKEYFFKHKGFLLCGFTEFYGFGKIQKCVTLSHRDNILTLRPSETLLTAMVDKIFSDGEDHLAIREDILDVNTPTPKIIFLAKWNPENDYFKVLKEKRNFVLEGEFDAIKGALTGVYEEHGVKVPSYIADRMVIQVPDKIQ